MCFNKGSLNCLQIGQNAAARLLKETRKWDQITPMLSVLHWLLVNFCIDFKYWVLTFRALHRQNPPYICHLLLWINHSDLQVKMFLRFLKHTINPEVTCHSGLLLLVCGMLYQRLCNWSILLTLTPEDTVL